MTFDENTILDSSREDIIKSTMTHLKESPDDVESILKSLYTMAHYKGMKKMKNVMMNIIDEHKSKSN